MFRNCRIKNAYAMVVKNICTASLCESQISCKYEKNRMKTPIVPSYLSFVVDDLAE